MDQKKPSGLPHNEFSTPFPGESMMTPVGNLPNDKPPTYPKPNQSAEDALEELNDVTTDRITESENMKNILNLLKSGKSPQILAKQYVRSMHMFGTMTNDLALLLEPIVTMQMGAMGDYAGIKMNLEEKNEPMIDEVELNTHIASKNKETSKERFDAFVEQYEKDIFGRMQQPDPDNPGFDIKGNPLVETEFWDDKYLDYQAGETVPFHDYYEYLVKTGEITPTLGWSTGGQTLLPGATPNVGAHPFVSDWDYELHPDQIAMMRPEAWETWSDEERETWERDLIDEQLLLDMTPEESFHWQGDIDEAYWDSWRTSVAGNPLMHGQAVPNAYDPGMTGNIYGRDRQHLLGTPAWDEDAQEWIRQDDPWYKFWK